MGTSDTNHNGHYVAGCDTGMHIGRLAHVHRFFDLHASVARIGAKFTVHTHGLTQLPDGRGLGQAQRVIIRIVGRPERVGLRVTGAPRTPHVSRTSSKVRLRRFFHPMTLHGASRVHAPSRLRPVGLNP